MSSSIACIVRLPRVPNLRSVVISGAFGYDHLWEPYDLLVWDNRSCWHYAMDDYGRQPRHVLRCTAAGEAPR